MKITKQEPFVSFFQYTIVWKTRVNIIWLKSKTCLKLIHIFIRFTNTQKYLFKNTKIFFYRIFKPSTKPSFSSNMLRTVIFLHWWKLIRHWPPLRSSLCLKHSDTLGVLFSLPVFRFCFHFQFFVFVFTSSFRFCFHFQFFCLFSHLNLFIVHLRHPSFVAFFNNRARQTRNFFSSKNDSLKRKVSLIEI